MAVLKKGSLRLSLKSGTELKTVAALKFGCKRGECRVCRIEILSGMENLSKRTPAENGLPPNQRLACQCALNGDVEINENHRKD